MLVRPLRARGFSAPSAESERHGDRARISYISAVISHEPVWKERHPPTLPALTGERRADVCVVGLGGSGLACTRALLAAGRSVVGIDAVSVAAGAAGRNGGFLLGGLAMFHHDAVERFGRDVARTIYEETLLQISRMADETPAAVRRTGSLRIAAEDAEREDCARHLEAMRRDKLPAETYHGPEGAGLLFPADAAFDPGLRCQLLGDDALSRGAQLFERSPALAIETGRVTTPDGVVTADDVVVAVDGRIEQVLPELRGRARTARLQMLATAPAHDFHQVRPVYARWGLDYWQQTPDGRIVLGGCRDMGGDAEWTAETTTSDVVQNALDCLLHERVHADATVTHRWAASVAYTQSGLPIVEQVRPRVWAIGAYSGTGNVVGALCGRAAAELILHGRSKIADLLRW
jgi:glycine/D-amino acid oxidase-like deaminating enzyme